VDPFAESPMAIHDAVEANNPHEMNMVTPVTMSGSGSGQTAFNQLAQGPQLIGEAEIFENAGIFPREDSNANYLNILFSPPLLPHISSSDLMYNVNSLGHNGGEVHDLHASTFAESVSRANIENADCEPEKVKKVWPARPKSPSRPQLWQDVAFGSLDNTFSSFDFDTVVESAVQTPQSDQDSEINLNFDIKRRMRDLKRNILVTRCNCAWDSDSICSQRYLCVNTMEIFDQGLYLYTHKYQPVYPLLHLPTFNPRRTSTPLLFVMCMIGMSLLKTEEAVDFVKKIYPVCLVSQII
jgi:hypothetical protein